MLLLLVVEVEVFELVDVRYELFVQVVVDVCFEQYNFEEVLVVEYDLEEPFGLLDQHNKMLLDEQVDDEQ
jgi:hypothetical protein